MMFLEIPQSLLNTLKTLIMNKMIRETIKHGLINLGMILTFVGFFWLLLYKLWQHIK